MPRPSQKLDRFAEALVEAAAGEGMVVDPGDARQIISEWVDRAAEAQGVTRRTALGRLDEAMVRDLVFEAVLGRIDEAPGADIYNRERTTVVPIPVLGRTIAASAEAARELVNIADDRALQMLRELAESMSLLGQMIAGTDDDQSVMIHEALGNRIAYSLEVAADWIGVDGALDSGVSRADLSRTLRRDARVLRELARPT
jgi:hypothetical protein